MAKDDTDLSYAMKHKYRVLPNGDFVPGVTTVMDVVDKPAFKWSASGIAADAAINNSRRKKSIVAKHRAWLVNAKGKTDSAIKKRTLGNAGTDNEVFAHWCRGEFNRQWKAKGARGNRIHDHALAWSNGEDVDVLDEDAGFMDALEEFHRLYRPVFHKVENVVLNDEYEFGGRFDCIATLHHWVWKHEKNVEVWEVLGTFLCDYKTGGHYPIEVAVQLEAYAHCKFGVYDDNGALIGFEDLPKLDGMRVIYLNEDGSLDVVDPFEHTTHEKAWRYFLACLELFAANKSINQTLGEEDE
jgi:hypothetical protein